jgi:hypothetical protein
VARFITYTHAWPLFITVLPPRFDLHDVEAYIPEVDALYLRRERFATLVDTSAVSALPGASERRRLAEWQNATIDSIQRYNVFTATVIQSPVVRGALTAMNWIFRPPNEQVVVKSFAEGFVRCVEKLRADGRAMPPEIAHLADGLPPLSVGDTLPSARSGWIAKVDPEASERGGARKG